MSPPASAVAPSGGALDSIVVPPGPTGELRTIAARPGNYIHHANGNTTIGRTLRMRGLLAGALVVDSAGRAAPDGARVFMLLDAVDSLTPADPPRYPPLGTGHQWSVVAPYRTYRRCRR